MERFWSKVNIGKPEECWEWKAGINSTGRGIFQYNGKSIHAHRMCWILTFGPIPENMCVLHKCDNGICINPNHLFLGTKGDNNTDRKRKGRSGNLRGEQHWIHKLSENDVRQIRKLYTPRGKYYQFKLAKIFNVSRSTIEEIISNRTWKHI